MEVTSKAENAHANSPNKSVRHRVAGVALVLVAASSLAAGIQEPVKVEGGQLSGIPGWAWNVRAYRGIPFAAPPVGRLRWESAAAGGPVARSAFGEKIRAPMHASRAFGRQPRYQPWIQSLDKFSEDCLYLNVWTPAGSATEKLPVMIWIYAAAVSAAGAAIRGMAATKWQRRAS